LYRKGGSKQPFVPPASQLVLAGGVWLALTLYRKGGANNRLCPPASRFTLAGAFGLPSLSTAK